MATIGYNATMTVNGEQIDIEGLAKNIGEIIMKDLMKKHFPAPTLPEICRANIDAGHNTEGDWAAYIDACLDAGVPVLMDSFECAAGRGADAVRAGGTIGLWKQVPMTIQSVNRRPRKTTYGWVTWSKKHNRPYCVASEFRSSCGSWMAYDTRQEAIDALLRAMTEYAKAN